MNKQHWQLSLFPQQQTCVKAHCGFLLSSLRRHFLPRQRDEIRSRRMRWRGDRHADQEMYRSLWILALQTEVRSGCERLKFLFPRIEQDSNDESAGKGNASALCISSNYPPEQTHRRRSHIVSKYSQWIRYLSLMRDYGFHIFANGSSKLQTWTN